MNRTNALGSGRIENVASGVIDVQTFNLAIASADQGGLDNGRDARFDNAGTFKKTTAGNYTMTNAAESVSGKYTFDQAGKTITMTPQGATAGNQFAVETLTDNKLTLVGTSGARLMLEKE